MERKLQYGRFGLTENPVGLYVCLPWKDGRTLLGEVRASRYDEIHGAIRLTVRHFCGDMWPVEPVASAVTVLE